MILKKRIAVILLMIVAIILLKSMVLSPAKAKNKNLKAKIESVKNENFEEEIDENQEQIQNSKYGNNKNNLYTKTKKDETKSDEIKFFTDISGFPYVKEIEKNSSADEKSYTIKLESEKVDFKNTVKYIDKTGFNVSIEKIRYNKNKKTEEYDILINLF